MKKALFYSLILSAVGLTQSCKTPPPTVITRTVVLPGAPPPSDPAPSHHHNSSPAPTSPKRYAYPDIAGVWSSATSTITIDPSNGGPFKIHIIQRGGKMNTSTAHWGEPFHKHFTFTRQGGREAVATLDSLTPSTISMKEENGRVHTWSKLSSR